MIARHLHVVEGVASGRISTREEIEAWAAERRRVLADLVEREGLGRQLALDDERQAA
jgi:hypothetical protein